MTMASAPPVIPAIKARYPNSRPITSTRNARCGEEAVTFSLSMASSATDFLFLFALDNILGARVRQLRKTLLIPVWSSPSLERNGHYFPVWRDMRSSKLLANDSHQRKVDVGYPR